MLRSALVREGKKRDARITENVMLVSKTITAKAGKQPAKRNTVRKGKQHNHQAVQVLSGTQITAFSIQLLCFIEYITQ